MGNKIFNKISAIFDQALNGRVLPQEIKDEILAFCSQFVADLKEDNKDITEEQILEVLDSQLAMRVEPAIDQAIFELEQKEALAKVFIERGYIQIMASESARILGRKDGSFVKIDIDNDKITKFYLGAGATARKVMFNFAKALPLNEGIEESLYASDNLKNVFNRLGYTFLNGEKKEIKLGEGKKIAIENANAYRILKSASAEEGATSMLAFLSIDQTIGSDKTSVISEWRILHEEAAAIIKAFRDFEEGKL